MCDESGVVGARSISAQPIVRPLVLYPPLEMSLVAFRVAEFPGEVFGLWLPEMITARGQGEWIYNQARRGRQDWRVNGGGRVLYHTVVADIPLRVNTTLRLVGAGVQLELRVENDTALALEEVVLACCYQLAAAPTFRDQEGTRTFAWAKGTLLNVATEGVPPASHNHHDPQHSSFMRLDDPERGFGFIGVEGFHCGATALAWCTHLNYYGNSDPSLCCVHADPVISRLEPGDVVLLRGWLGWTKGSLAELCAQARHFIQ